MKVTVRKPFRFLPALVWAMGIDLIDIVTNIADAILAFVGIGLVTNTIVDVLQGVLGLIIFENPSVAILALGGDVVLPPALDIFPTYTAITLAVQWGIIK